MLLAHAGGKKLTIVAPDTQLRGRYRGHPHSLRVCLALLKLGLDGVTPPVSHVPPVLIVGLQAVPGGQGEGGWRAGVAATGMAATGVAVTGWRPQGWSCQVQQQPGRRGSVPL